MQLPHTTTIDDVLGSGDWATALREIFDDPARNANFLKQLENFVGNSFKLTEAKSEKAIKVIKAFFEALSLQISMRNIKSYVTDITGIARETVGKYIDAFIIGLAKSLDKNIDIILTEEEFGTLDVPESGKVFDFKASPKATALAEAFVNSVWLQSFMVRLETGKRLDQYIPPGSRAPMGVPTFQPKFERPKKEWQDVVLEEGEKDILEEGMADYYRRREEREEDVSTLREWKHPDLMSPEEKQEKAEIALEQARQRSRRTAAFVRRRKLMAARKIPVRQQSIKRVASLWFSNRAR